MSEKHKKLSSYLCYILRHAPEVLGDPHEVMDVHGWVSVDKLIRGVNAQSEYRLTKALLEEIAAEDEKGRYRFDLHHSRIKCCQGHSVEWIEPELTYREPPEFLYHGTTDEALGRIRASGHISKMQRHAVHMQADPGKAWQSAARWRKTPVVLKIAALELSRRGVQFGVTENDVWCAEDIPADAIAECIYTKPL